MALAFSPFDQTFLVFPALIYLFASWMVLAPKHAAIRGFLFGLGLFGAGVSWVFVSVYNFGGHDIINASLVTLFFVVFWSLFPALTGYLAGLLRNKKVGKQLSLLPVLWVLIEHLRGTWIFNGFPWLQIAYTQMDTGLAGYVPVVGGYGVGLITAFIAMCGLKILLRDQNSLGYFLSIICLWAGGLFLKNIQWTYPAGDKLTVSIIQGNISQDRKWAQENRDATLKLYLSLTNEHWSSDIIVWPETSIPAYYSEVKDSFLVPLEQKAIANNTDLVVSLPMKDEAQSRRYNSVLVLGQRPGVYRKNHLLPFGEYMPLQPVAGYILKFLNIRLGDFASGGGDQELLSAAGYHFITSICYEDVFAINNATQLEKAAFLVNVTNDAWFGHSIEPVQHMQIARMRALETGRYLIRATNTGLTGVVAPNGEIINQAPLFKVAVIKEAIVPMTGMTFYGRFGDAWVITFIWGLLLLNIFELKFYRNK